MWHRIGMFGTEVRIGLEQKEEQVCNRRSSSGTEGRGLEKKEKV